MAKDAIDAAVQEATGEPTVLTVKWNAQEWEVPGPTLDDAPALALTAMEQGKSMSFLEAILGRGQWRRFVSGKRATARDAAELMKVILEEGYGISLGG
jgi:2,4-dienoyl-CoA reductase-like NADH-dependent reductase (Old Yellow Enzyme family)